MAAPPTTAVEAHLARRRWFTTPLALLLGIALLAGITVLALGTVLVIRHSRQSTSYFALEVEHFKYGSIGAEPKGGIPYAVWQALPRLFPDTFRPAVEKGAGPYSVFGFLYEDDARGRPRDLPIGISRRTIDGIDMVWFNCSVCHVGTWRTDAAAHPQLVAGMPSNNLDLYRFLSFLLDVAAVDERLAPASLVDEIDRTGTGLGFLERQFWLFVVAPALREGLLERRSRLLPLLEHQPAWGPGRVDTFNPYKVIQFSIPAAAIPEEERIGASDFPSVFLQRPREGMHLHWDGNNSSLAERNLSAAIGAGVTPQTVHHASIERVAHWLGDLSPPPSPLRPDPEAVERGWRIYAGWTGNTPSCTSCHGYMRRDGTYVFRGEGIERIGQVEPIDRIGTDRRRLDSYTETFRRRQLDEIFEGTPYDFRHFTKTDGYANHPLDGLWLRGPYLHNGSVPTLADLLEPPALRPKDFVRGIDILDQDRGGFQAPPCGSEAGRAALAAVPRPGFCFDTSQPGNANGGHLYGTGLDPQAKADLLAYLKTF